MDLTRSQAPRAGAALFTWQTLVPAFGLGCLAFRHFWPALAGLFLLWFVLARLADCRARPLLLALAFAAGLAAAHAAMPAAPQATPDWMLRGEKARVEGVVEAVEGKPGREARVILDEVRCRPGDAGWRDLPGKLAWTWREPVFRPKPGDRLEARLRVKPQRGFAGEENWDLRFYWARQGVFWRAWSQRWWGDPELLKAGEGGLDRRRADIAERVAGLTPDGQGGALAAALATGDRFGLDRETVDLFRQASLAHSLALSGLHLGLAAGLGAALAWLAARLRPGILLLLPLPKLAVLCGLPLALAYLWLGGAGPSLVRAFLMFAAWGGLLWLGRPRGLLDGLLAAVALILLLNPLSVFDLGLRLSVVAVAGILAGAPLVRRGLSRLLDGRPAWLRLPTLWLGCLLGVSLCANIALLPLLLHSFGVIHPNLLWNAVWLPLLGAAVMPLDLAGLALAALPGAEEAARWCLAGAGRLCGEMIGLLRLGEEAGLAPTVAGARTGWLGAAGYWLFCCWLVSPRRKDLLPGALALALLAAPVASGWLERGVEVRLLDVGQGQAVLVRGPDGGRTLIDGGGFPGDFDVGEALVAPALLADRSPRLQRVLLSHPQVDHGGGLAWVAEHFDPGLFASTGQTSDTRFMERLELALKSGGISTRRLRAGDELDLGRGLRLEVLHPAALTGDLNADSLVLRLLWNGRPLALLPGDVEGEGLKTLLRREADLSAELLVLPHHGSDNSLSPALYDRASPKVAAASCGYLGRFDFPGPKVRAAMARRDVSLLTTASRGELAFRWQAPDAPLEIRTRLPTSFPRDACQIGRVGLPSRPWSESSAFSP